jgi:hypothetical protein
VRGDLVQFCFVVNGTEVGKTGVQPGTVIEGFDVVEDSGASFGASGKAVMVDQFVFEGAPEGFDEGVVVAVSFATHGSDEMVLSQDLPVSGTGERGAAVRVDDEGGSGPPLA